MEGLGFPPIHNERFCSEIKSTNMKIKTIAIINANAFVDNIYDEMRKNGYPEDLQIAVISQIKVLLK